MPRYQEVLGEPGLVSELHKVQRYIGGPARLRVRGQDGRVHVRGFASPRLPLDALSRQTWRASLTFCGRSSRPQPPFIADGHELRRCLIDVAHSLLWAARQRR